MARTKYEKSENVDDANCIEIQKSTHKWASTWQNQQMARASREYTDQPWHPSSLIKVFAVRSVGC